MTVRHQYVILPTTENRGGSKPEGGECYRHDAEPVTVRKPGRHPVLLLDQEKRRKRIRVREDRMDDVFRLHDLGPIPSFTSLKSLNRHCTGQCILSQIHTKWWCTRKGYYQLSREGIGWWVASDPPSEWQAERPGHFQVPLIVEAFTTQMRGLATSTLTDDTMVVETDGGERLYGMGSYMPMTRPGT